MRLLARDPVTKKILRHPVSGKLIRCATHPDCSDCPDATAESLTLVFADVELASLACVVSSNVRVTTSGTFSGSFCLRQTGFCIWRYQEWMPDGFEFHTIGDTDCSGEQICGALWILATRVAGGYNVWAGISGTGSIFYTFIPIANCADEAVGANEFTAFTSLVGGALPANGIIGINGTVTVTTNAGPVGSGCGGNQWNDEENPCVDSPDPVPPPDAVPGHCYALVRATKTCPDDWVFDGDPIIVSAENMPRHFTLNAWRVRQGEGSCTAYYWIDLGAIADEFGECDPEAEVTLPALPAEEDCECDTTCPEDCDSCFDDYTFDVDTNPTQTVTRTGCEWLSELNSLTCADDLWTVQLDDGLGGDLMTATAPVSGPCPPTTAGAWTKISGSGTAITGITTA